MKMIDFLRFSRYSITEERIASFEGDFEDYIRGHLSSSLIEELKKVIKIEDLNNYDPYTHIFEASVVIIPTEKAVEISKKLKRLEELEREYVADND